ncbi:hypothetical protein CB1_000995001 [Camelus ferus]|nr:hypothetical protein CB1_000995001 [Camelus ferus]
MLSSWCPVPSPDLLTLHRPGFSLDSQPCPLCGLKSAVFDCPPVPAVIVQWLSPSAAFLAVLLTGWRVSSMRAVRVLGFIFCWKNRCSHEPRTRPRPRRTCSQLCAVLPLDASPPRAQLNFQDAGGIQGDMEEMLSGVVVISGKDAIQHQGVSLTVEGSVNLQLSAKSVGVFEAFYNSVKLLLELASRPSGGGLPSPPGLQSSPAPKTGVPARRLLAQPGYLWGREGVTSIHFLLCIQGLSIQSCKRTKDLGRLTARLQPIQIINSTIEMVKPGKFPSGKTEIPFEFPLLVKGNKVLYETYHGVFVNIQYTLRCDMRRSLLAKDLTKTCEFIVHSAPQKGKLTPSPVDFTITPETLQNVKERALLPKFLIRGHLNSTSCVITQPLTGELVVESSEAAIKSIELQLVRVETCGKARCAGRPLPPSSPLLPQSSPPQPSKRVFEERCAEGYARDATEIQNIQIADGDVCRSLSVPIYMVFPRLFTCPTLETTNFKVEFEVNIVVLLHPDHLITENFPLKLCRT